MSRPPIRIGYPGWNYRHWRGAFYPEKLAAKRWFSFYAEQFDTAEIKLLSPAQGPDLCRVA